LAEKAERVDGDEGGVIGDVEFVDVGGFRVEVNKDKDKHCVGVYEGADV
jgi:hypothetical protein